MNRSLPITLAVGLPLVAAAGVLLIPKISSQLHLSTSSLRTPVLSSHPPPPADRPLEQAAAVKAALPVESDADKAARYLGYLGVPVTGAALRAAAGDARTYSIDLLIKAGIDVNDADQSGRTPLSIAVAGDNPPVVRLLLDRGATPDRADLAGRTPLILAAELGSVRIMEILLAAGAAVDAADSNGHRAIHYALRARHPKAVALLTHAGASVAGECAEGKSVLLHAVESGDSGMIREVLNQKPQRIGWTAGATDLFWRAFHAKDEAMLGLLSDAFSEPPLLGGARQPLLAYAIAWNDPGLVRRLLAWGASPDTQLRIPAEPSFIDLVAKKNLEFYLEKEHGMTALMLAAGMGRLECVQALLGAGASRNLTTENYRMIALYFGARSGSAETVQVLLGKDPRKQNRKMQVKISLSTQQATVLKDGIRWIQTTVSTGRKGFKTPTGNFVVTDKNRKRISSIFHVPMPYFMRLSCSDFGMHEGYVPGYPASHGCIRVPAKVARNLYKEIEIGTLVTISE